MARGAFASSAQSILRADQRKPILLLRSFVDDERFNFLAANKALFDASLEARLTRHFSRIGPYIAVGSPSEKLPVVGAARANLPESGWQAQVMRWVDDSRLILLLVGTTKWVTWELQEVVKRGAADRLVICFPPIKTPIKWKEGEGLRERRRKFNANMQSRLDTLTKVFRGTKWEASVASLADDACTLRSIVFRDDGSVVAVRTRWRSRNAYHLAILVADWALRAEHPKAERVGHGLAKQSDPELIAAFRNPAFSERARDLIADGLGERGFPPEQISALSRDHSTLRARSFGKSPNYQQILRRPRRMRVANACAFVGIVALYLWFWEASPFRFCLSAAVFFLRRYLFLYA